MPSRELTGSVAVVTGATSGVGRATARAFASHRARLVLAARNPEALGEVERECSDSGADVLVVPTDISQSHAPDELANAAVERFGRVDIWVEAASVLIAGRLQDTPVEELRALVDTNVAGTTLGARAALRLFESQGSGTLIIVSSLLGLLPSPLAPAYVMSKFATRGLALSLRQDVSRRGQVQVCAVLPGPVDTPMFQRAANRTGRQLRAIPPAYAPERLAATIVSCARRPRRQATAGVISRAQLLSHRIAPRPTEWLVGEWSARLLIRRAEAPGDSGAVLARQPPEEVSGGWRRGRLRRRIGERFGEWMATRRA